MGLPNNNPGNGTSDGSNASAASSGLQAVEGAVDYVNKTVLSSQVTGMTGTSQTLADQAAAMMIQDVRAFMQGNEQLITAGMGKAISYVVDPATTKKGEDMIKALSTAMKDLTTFAGEVAKAASGVLQDFQNDK